LKEIKTLNINERDYSFTYHLGGDLKFIATVFGINNANSDYPCPWCTWKNQKIELIQKEVENKLKKEKNEIRKIKHQAISNYVLKRIFF